MFHTVFIEISGICNAQCPYCLTGSRHGERPQAGNVFMSAKNFRAVIARLQELELVTAGTRYDLYNWGEPFLNPEVREILAHLSSLPNPFVISSNASVFPDLPRKLFRNLDQIVISMPGFSQASYDRIHKFKLSNVLRNIDKIISTVGNRRVNICMHAYQFNAQEILAAKEYFKPRGVLFTVYPAYFNDYDQAKGYLTGTLPPALNERAQQELILGDSARLLASRPNDYVCPQFSMLTIGEHGECVTCCVAPKTSADYSFGSLFELTREEILERKLNRPLCKECATLKIDYWAHASPTYSTDAFSRLPMGRLKTALWRLKALFA